MTARKARTVCVKRGENPNLAWKKKEEKEAKKSKNAKKKYAFAISPVEQVFPWLQLGSSWLCRRFLIPETWKANIC